MAKKIQAGGIVLYASKKRWQAKKHLSPAAGKKGSTAKSPKQCSLEAKAYCQYDGPETLFVRKLKQYAEYSAAALEKRKYWRSDDDRLFLVQIKGIKQASFDECRE